MKSAPLIAVFLAVALTISALPVRGERATRTIVVRMVGDAKGYRFQPSSITARVGDVVRFVNVSGGPHNVAFWPDRLPAGAVETLQKNMGQTTGPLMGAMIFEPKEVYTLSLAGLPAGAYNYYCLPHQAMNMTGRIAVRPR
jgi:plastocyanin